ncbi:MAG: hypothetical protein RLZZ271_946 [Pseudomonadota bacterium]|jgi:hypothetical protein
MKRRLIILSSLATLAVLGAGSGYLAWRKWWRESPGDARLDELAQQAASQPLVQPSAPAARLLGWNINWVEQSRLRRDLPKVWERFKASGANTARDSQEWTWVQRGRNSPFTPDKHVKAAEDLIHNDYKAAGVQSLRLLCYGHPAFWSGEEMPSPDQFARFAKGFVAYAEHVMGAQPDATHFEVWNEWNHTLRFKGNEEIRRGPLYARLFVQAASAIKRKRPDAQVITQGLAVSKESGGLPDNEFLVRTLNHPGVLQLADGIGLHPYYFKLNDSPERLMNYLAFTRQQLLREVKGYKQRTLPFFITETGFPTAEKGSLSIGSRWGYGIDENLQAAFLARLAILCMSQPHVQGLLFHNFVDSGSDKANIEHNYGVLRSDLSAKLAYARMAALVPVLAKASEFEWIAGKTTEANSVKEAFDAEVALVYAVRFQAEPGRWCTAIWATSGKPKTLRLKATPDEGELQACDKQYGLSPRSIKPAAGGVFELQLDTEPVYVMQAASGKPAALQVVG